MAKILLHTRARAVRVFIGVGFVVALVACKGGSTQQNPAIPVSYPVTATADSFSTYFNERVEDPYRWLEDANATATQQWVDTQNAVTNGYLEKIPYREAIRQRLTELWDYPKHSRPSAVGEYLFFTKNDGLQDQDVIYRQKGADGTPEVFLDPNTLSEDGTVRASIASFSKDDKYLVMRYNESGSDWATFRVFEVATGKPLSDEVRWVKFSGASWFKDGFYYSRFPTPKPGEELTTRAVGHAVYYHKLGTPQTADRKIFDLPEAPRNYVSAGVTEDESHLVLYSSPGTYGTEVYLQSLATPGAPIRKILKANLVEGVAQYNEYTVLDNLPDGKLLVFTDYQAPNKRIVLVDPNAPDPTNWKDVVAQKEQPLTDVSTGGGKIFASYLKDVSSEVLQYDYNGSLERTIELPTLGNAFGFYGEKGDTHLYYSFVSFTYPITHYKLEIATGKSTVFYQTEVDFNPSDYETKQVKYPSKDGTLIPMFIVHKKGLKLDGTAPTYLYGYGGFNIVLSPRFNVAQLLLLENGGVYAVANLRGGGEYGEEWHRSGMLENKQNVFDDFIAAAEYLIQEKYTSSKRLAIAGGSNGGLLVGACMTQRPDLFAVALPAVGVMDMLRYHLFSVGYAWAVEYGRADSTQQQYQTLKSYSPLHNLKAGTAYPATMVTTADHDDRVVPAHSYKFTAQLQASHKGEAPILIRVETKAGHGGGTPTRKSIEQWTDVWAFTFYNLGVQQLAQPATKE